MIIVLVTQKCSDAVLEVLPIAVVVKFIIGNLLANFVAVFYEVENPFLLL